MDNEGREDEESPAETTRRLSFGIQSLRPPARLLSNEPPLGPDSADDGPRSILRKASEDPGIESLAPPQRTSRSIVPQPTTSSLRPPSAKNEDKKDPPHVVFKELPKEKTERTVSALTSSVGSREELNEAMNEPRAVDSRRSFRIPMTKVEIKDRMFRKKTGAMVHVQKYFLPMVFLLFAAIGVGVAASVGALTTSSSSSPPATIPAESMPPSASPTLDVPAPASPAQSESTLSLVPTPAPTPGKPPQRLRTRRKE